MSKYIAFILIVSVVGCSSSQEKAPPNKNDESPTVKEPAPSHEFKDPREVLAAGRIDVDVMELATSPQMTDLGKRIQESMRKNPEWWLEQRKKTKPGETIPYDARMGLSEKEYKEFLALPKQATMQKKAGATLVVSKKGDDVYVFDGGEALPELTGIEIDLAKDVVRTPFGDATERSVINAPDSVPLGQWNGVQWKLETSATVAKLSVGRVKRSDRCVIYYDVRKGTTRISQVLLYDVPAK